MGGCVDVYHIRNCGPGTLTGLLIAVALVPKVAIDLLKLVSRFTSNDFKFIVIHSNDAVEAPNLGRHQLQHQSDALDACCEVCRVYRQVESG